MRERYWHSDEGWYYPDTLDNDDIVIIDIRDAANPILDLTEIDDVIRGTNRQSTPVRDDWLEDNGSRFSFGGRPA